MKITFVGTSHGVPEKNRYCTCIMLESNGAIYFIDAGAPIVDFLVDNGKSDHTIGLVHLVNLMNWYYKRSSAEIFITEQEHIDATVQWTYTAGDGRIDEERIKLKVPYEGSVYQDENIKVEYIPTAHMKNSYAIIVTEGDKRVLFGGDFSHGLRKHDVPSVISDNIDAFVCELAHFTMDELSPYLDICNAKRVFFIHAKPARYTDIENIKGRYPFEVITPDDSDEYLI